MRPDSARTFHGGARMRLASQSPRAGVLGRSERIGGGPQFPAGARDMSKHAPPIVDAIRRPRLARLRQAPTGPSKAAHQTALVLRVTLTCRRIRAVVVPLDSRL
eukprot:1331215-Pyramimonas_sp.AAC.1